MEVWSLSSRIKVLYLKIWRKCVVTVTDSVFEGSFTGGGGEIWTNQSSKVQRSGITGMKLKLKLLDASFRM